MSTEREQAVVVITGGAGRIGTAIARAFVRDGARVALCDVHEETLARAATHLRETSAVASSDLATIVADVADERAVEAAFAKAETTLGAITTLVTCAAVYPNTPLVESSVDEWERVFAVNVRGVMLACRTAARGWIARGMRGAIVNLSSGAARSARRGASAYCGSKAALEMITQTFAVELGAHGIRVNAVAPGLVMDEVISAPDPARNPYYDAMLAATPLGRTGTADDIAEAVLFLASERSAWTTGAVLDVTGGSHCGRTHLGFTPRLPASSATKS